MNVKKMFIISVILMFLLVPASFAADGDFEIPQVSKDITVKDDASLVIIEEIQYDIDGSVAGVYRDISKREGQAITDISVETPGYYNSYQVEEDHNSTKIKVWLYTDEEKTQQTSDANVSVKYKYTMSDAVSFNFNVAVLNYRTWGEEWATKVDHLESVIHIPGSKDNVEFKNNPEDNVVSSRWTSDDTLTTKVDNIDAYTSFEQIITMPASYFKNN